MPPIMAARLAVFGRRQIIRGDARPPNGHVRKPRDFAGAGVDHGVMDLDDDACYRALLTRDARFDGRMFVGVKTTGIYCRPVCPATTPKRANMTFYLTAAAAEEASLLRTQAMREHAAARKRRRYLFAIVRIRFPDKYVIQGGL